MIHRQFNTCVCHILRKGAFEHLSHMHGQQTSCKNVKVMALYKSISSISKTTKCKHLTTVIFMLTFAGSAYRNVVCWLSSLTLCPDVHCKVAFILDAVSDYGALFIA